MIRLLASMFSYNKLVNHLAMGINIERTQSGGTLPENQLKGKQVFFSAFGGGGMLV